MEAHDSYRYPRIRFAGNSDAWEQRKLGEVLSLLKDGTHGTHQNSDEGVYLLSAKNIKNGQIVIDEETDRKISIEEYETIHSNFKLKKDDVLLTIVGSIGETAILKNPDIATFQRSVAFLRPNEDTISIFLKTEIDTDIFQKELADRKSQSAQPGVYLGELEKIPFYLTSIQEQQKIGTFFSNLETLITLHQRKYEKSINIKRSMLDKMFPKNRNLYPEVRINGFTDAWERCRLGDVVEIISGNAWRSSDYSDNGEYLVITIANVSGEVFINDKIGNHISCDNPDKYLLNENDILLSMTGNVGRVSKMSKIRGVLNQRVGKISPISDGINAEFLFHVLKNPNFERSMIDAGKGAAQKNISNSDVLSYIFLMPREIKEQQSIACCLDKLDNLIMLHWHEYIKLVRIKYALLQAMFV